MKSPSELDKKGKPGKKPVPQRMNPVRSTLEIIFLYATIGIVWIFTSDIVLSWIIPNPDLIQRLQTVKGVTYVLVTGLLFYLIIKRRMGLYFDSITHLNRAVEDLETSNAHLRELEIKLTNLAYFDSLTGLMSKNRLVERVQEHIQLRGEEPFGLVFLSIDTLQNVHELKGHDAGDELIRLMGREIAIVFPSPSDIGRLSGPQFVILWKDLPSRSQILVVMKEKVAQIGKRFLICGENFFVNLSIGISLYPENGQTFETLLQQADIAQNLAREHGKNDVVLFRPALQVTQTKFIELGNLMHQAILNREFSVHYQPIYNVQKQEFTSSEALIRWNHPGRGFIPPMEFIPIAEKSEMIRDLTWIVVEECFRQKKAWESEGFFARISINLSAKVLGEENFLSDMQKMIDKYAIEPKDNFAIEVTESALLEHLDESIQKFQKLKEMGFSLALDDFGTGYSSLKYLMTFPVQFLKIDREFIKMIVSETSEVPFLRNIIHLAHEIGVTVISEGVEEEFQRRRLEEYGTDFIQGYLFSKPLPAETVLEFFREHQK